MKARLHSYTSECNGITIEVIPETEDEQSMIDAMWKFGTMHTGYSSDNPRARSYNVTAFRNKEAVALNRKKGE